MDLRRSLARLIWSVRCILAIDLRQLRSLTVLFNIRNTGCFQLFKVVVACIAIPGD